MSLELFKKRYSCRNFKKETIEDEILKEILEVARLSPSSLGLEPWKFLVIKDAKKREELSLIANHQSHEKTLRLSLLSFLGLILPSILKKS